MKLLKLRGRSPLEEEPKCYRPRGAARDLFHDRSPEILLEGPAGTGKTRAVLEKVLLCAIKYPVSRHLLVRKTRASMSQSVLVTLERIVMPVGLLPQSSAGRFNRQSYVLSNGSELAIGGLDKASRVMSAEYDTITAFEATELTLDDWETMTSRLRWGRMPYHQAIADCNPGAPSHWLNERASAGRMTRLLSRHLDNPACTPDYLDRLSQLTGVRRQRLLLGHWAKVEGLVYADFDAKTHVVNHFVPPGHWRKFRSIDFGFTNPFVCQWWALDEDDRLYMYREFYMSEMNVPALAPTLVDLTGTEEIEATVCDHDSQSRDLLHEAGIDTIPALKDVTVGIQRVQDRLRPARDGKPRLFLMRDTLYCEDDDLRNAGRPVCTLAEIDGYAWNDKKDQPIKQDDHGMDAMRYAVMYVDGGQRFTYSVAKRDTRRGGLDIAIGRTRNRWVTQ